jgi:hypothetical protein
MNRQTNKLVFYNYFIEKMFATHEIDAASLSYRFLNLKNVMNLLKKTSFAEFFHLIKLPP